MLLVKSRLDFLRLGDLPIFHLTHAHACMILL